MSFLLPLNTGAILFLLLLLYSIVVFLVARVYRDNSVMDIAYGPAFFISALGAAYLTDSLSALPILLISCLGLWAARLAIRIFRKNYGQPEDARYAKWRTQWLQNGRTYFLIRSYLQINLLQIVIITIVSAPVIITLSYPTYYSVPFIAAGLVVFFFGLLYEMVADYQLDQFITRKKAGTESANLMRKGLFRYSRRPNYFGETLIWWGLAIMVLPLPFGYLALLSPVMITYIVTRITGPMLERSFLERFPEQYQHYIDSTSYFIPWLPNSTNAN